MSGFFGIIHVDRGEWQGFRLQPRPDAAARLIWQCRALLETAPYIPGNGPVELAPFVRFEDAGVLSLLTGWVFEPVNPDFQMTAATAIALLLNAPYYCVEGYTTPGGCHCRLLIIHEPTAEAAHNAFMIECGNRFLLPATEPHTDAMYHAHWEECRGRDQ